MRRIIPATLLLLGVLALAATGAAAGRTVAGCTTIDTAGTHSLEGDVTVEGTVNGSCLLVTANDTVIEGGGHVLQGDGNDTGIAVRGGRNVTVRGVNVTGWTVGIHVRSGSEDVVVTANDVVENGVGSGKHGILVEAGDRASPPVVVGNAVRWNYNGIQVANTPNAVVRDNEVVRNVRTGVVVTGSSHGSDVVDNRIVGSDLDFQEPEQLDGSGVFVSTSSAVRIERNHIEANGNGVQLYFLAGSPIINNTITRNARGVWVRGQWEAMAAHCNRFVDNLEYGVENNGDTVHNVTRNYWGAASGPAGNVTDPSTGAVADGSGDNVSSSLHWDPYLRGRTCGAGDGDDGDGNVVPVPDIAPNRTSVTVGETIAFGNGTTHDPDGTVVRHDWRLGRNQGTATGPSVTHTYRSPGTFSVNLEVTDDDGGSNATTVRVFVNEPPEAVIEANRTTVVAGETVGFDAGKSDDPDGLLVRKAWSFGAGEANGSGERVSHTYDDTGTYQVDLTVTDDDGATDTTRAYVTVLPPDDCEEGDDEDDDRDDEECEEDDDDDDGDDCEDGGDDDGEEDDDGDECEEDDDDGDDEDEGAEDDDSAATGDVTVALHPGSPTAGQRIVLNGTVSNGTADGNVSYEWVIDGDRALRGERVRYAFTVPAPNHSVSLRINDGSREIGRVDRRVAVGAPAPSCPLSATICRYDFDRDGIETHELQRAIGDFATDDLATGGLQRVIADFLED